MRRLLCILLSIVSCQLCPIKQLSMNKDAVPTPLRFDERKQPYAITKFVQLSGTFDFLERGLRESGLLAWLREQSNKGRLLTVFAPTDDAFYKLPKGTRVKLFANPTDRLRDVLLYHIVDGDARKSDLRSGRLKTVHGEDILVQLDPHGTILNGAGRIIKPDIELEDGIIHTINTVLIP